MNGTSIPRKALHRNSSLISNISHTHHYCRRYVHSIPLILSHTNNHSLHYNAYNFHSFRSQSTAENATSRSTIDQVLLSKQEDPMVLKQKEELLRAFASQLSKSLKRFETSRKMRLKFLLKTIYGCTVIEVKQYCAMFGIHEQTSVKDVPPLFWAGSHWNFLKLYWLIDWLHYI